MKNLDVVADALDNVFGTVLVETLSDFFILAFCSFPTF